MIASQLLDMNVLTQRILELRERLRTANTHACAERSRLQTLAWKDSDGESIDIRWARMLEKVLLEQTISIRNDELIVGSQTKYNVGASPFLAYDAEIAKVLENEKFAMMGETETADITEEERRNLIEDMHYWRGKSVICKVNQRMKEIVGDKIDDILQSRIIVLHSSEKHIFGNSSDFKNVIKNGLKSIIAEIEEKKNSLTFTNADDMEKYNFLAASIISLRAVINFAHRHAALARDMAKKEKELVRRQELEEIARICDKVPEYPADTFYEAIQSLWFVYLCAFLESNTCPGRLDQYIYPYFKRDVTEGKLTRSEAGELLACLWIKFYENAEFQIQFQKENTQGELRATITIGGVTPDGKDATNELSYLILEVARQLRLTRPSVALCWHPNLSEDLLLKAVETNRDIGGGIPSFLNGDNTIVNLMDYGFALEDARDMYFQGCVHPYTNSSCSCWLVCNINTPKIFELTLNNGIDPKTGKQLGPATGNPVTFLSFEELFKAFKAQYSYWIDMVCKLGNIYLLTKAETCRVPLNSSLMKDCISNGKDIFSSGLRYQQYNGSFNGRGLQNVNNSMIAIKKHIFEDKKITMRELLEALQNNFNGYEELRQQLISSPKWGNDDDEADSLHAELWDWTGNYLKQANLQPWQNIPVLSRRGGATWHYVAGKGCGAFPDGRKAGEPMGDGNVSAVGGTDHNGPTAVINSASKLNTKASLSSLFNMKFAPHLLKTDERKLKLLSLIRTYFNRGGYHIQFNMISKETLLDARAHPEQHRDLIVRVAGFSAYFVDLAPAVQDDIIARTEHNLS